MDTIYFDMDGTIADLYGVENWLQYLIDEDVTPYKDARPLIKMQPLARKLNTLQKKGYKIGIISWLSKSGSDEYNMAVTEIKKQWLRKHLASVKFDEVHIVEYGTPKQSLGSGILFDDEPHNRETWCGNAYDVNNIMGVLEGL